MMFPFKMEIDKGIPYNLIYFSLFFVINVVTSLFMNCYSKSSASIIFAFVVKSDKSTTNISFSVKNIKNLSLVKVLKASLMLSPRGMQNNLLSYRAISTFPNYVISHSSIPYYILSTRIHPRACCNDEWDNLRNYLGNVEENNEEASEDSIMIEQRNYSNVLNYSSKDEPLYQQMSGNPEICEDIYGEGHIEIINKQTDIPIDIGQLEQNIRCIKTIMGITPFSSGIYMITMPEMKKMNNQLRGKNSSTDVLSVSHKKRTAGVLPVVENSDDLELGDTFLCPSFIQFLCNEDRSFMESNLENNRTNKIEDRGVSKCCKEVYTVNERLPYLMIHSFLHLMGYDHENDEESKHMINREEEIITEYKKNNMFRFRNTGQYIVGEGIDICHIPRIRKILEIHEQRFLKRAFTIREKVLYEKLRHNNFQQINNSNNAWTSKAASYLARRFATKEAVAKALGTGLKHLWPGGIRMRDIEVWSLPSGQPVIYLLNDALKRSQNLGVVAWHISQADEKDFAISHAIALGSCQQTLLS